MNKLSLKMKLVVGFGVLLLQMMILGIWGYHSSEAAEKLSDEVDNAAQKEELSLLMQASIEMQSNAARGFLLTGREDMLSRDEEGKASFKQNYDELDGLVKLPEGRKLDSAIQEVYAQYRPFLDKQIELRRQGI